MRKFKGSGALELETHLPYHRSTVYPWYRTFHDRWTITSAIASCIGDRCSPERLTQDWLWQSLVPACLACVMVVHCNLRTSQIIASQNKLICLPLCDRLTWMWGFLSTLFPFKVFPDHAIVKRTTVVPLVLEPGTKECLVDVDFPGENEFSEISFHIAIVDLRQTLLIKRCINTSFNSRQPTNLGWQKLTWQPKLQVLLSS